jgi:hypothetical protein
MKPFIYLSVMRGKNAVLDYARNKAKLLMLAINVALVAGALVGARAMRSEADLPAFSGNLLTGAVFILTSICVYPSALACMKGGAVFGLEDANLVFTAPIEAGKVLAYGAAWTVGKTAGVMLALMLAYSPVLDCFVPGIAALPVIIGFFVLAAILAWASGQALCIAVGGRPGRALLAKVLAGLVFAPLVVQALGFSLAGGAAAEVLERVCASPLLKATPVSGWAAAGCGAVLSGRLGEGLAFLGLMLAALAGLRLFIARGRPDFYEEALYTAETLAEKRRAARARGPNQDWDVIKDAFEKSGRGRAGRAVKSGLRGAGGAAFFHRQALEAGRRNWLGLVGNLSFIGIAGSCLLVFLAASGMERGEEAEILLFPILLPWLFIQAGTVKLGECGRELGMHYLYLAPEPPAEKLLWANLAGFLRFLLEGALLFGGAGLILGAAPGLVLGSMLCYALFSLKLLGLNCLALRVSGVDISGELFSFLYIAAAMATSVPGFVLGLAAAVRTSRLAPLLIGMCAWESLAGLICFALSAGLLNNGDMPSPGERRG